MGVLIFVEYRAIPTAWYCVEIRKPDPYASLSADGTKGEHGEAGSRAPHVSKATCDRTRRLRILVFNFQHKSPLG